MNIHRPISSIMTMDVKAVPQSALMTEVADIFDSNDFHHLPVVAEGHAPVGLISKHDYYQLQHHFTRKGWEMAEASNKRLFESLTVKEVMTSTPVTLDKDKPISDAIELFLTNRIHAIMVTEVGTCIGILTPFDLIKEMKKLSVVMQ